MPTATATKEQVSKTATQAQEMSVDVLYATLGAGQIVMEKAKDLAGRTRYYYTPEGFKAYWADQGKKAQKTFEDLTARGRKIVKSVESSAAYKRAEEQTKAARTQVKAAATSVRKAFAADVEATKVAAKKVS
jgi:hypothetical protein